MERLKRMETAETDGTAETAVRFVFAATAIHDPQRLMPFVVVLQYSFQFIYWEELGIIDGETLAFAPCIPSLSL